MIRKIKMLVCGNDENYLINLILVLILYLIIFYVIEYIFFKKF
jgi:ABC-type transport system involved in multi-copper enzyme maturation permease subunit